MRYEPKTAYRSALTIVQRNPGFSTDDAARLKLGIHIPADQNPNVVYKAWAAELIRYAGQLQDVSDALLLSTLLERTPIIRRPCVLLKAMREAETLLNSVITIQCEARRCVVVLEASGLNHSSDLSQSVSLSVGNLDAKVRTVIDSVSSKLTARSNKQLALTNLLIALIALVVSVATLTKTEYR